MTNVKGIYCRWIGQHKNAEGKVVRTRFYFGGNERAAKLAAKEKATEWKAIVRTVRAANAQRQATLEGAPVLIPLWQNGEAQAKAPQAQAPEQQAPAEVFKTIGFTASPTIERLTIKEAADRFVKSKEAQIGLAAGRGIKVGSANAICKTVYISLGISTATKNHSNRAVTRKPLDVNQLLCTLTKQQIENYVNFWMALPDGIAARTAVNYCKSFKAVIDWADSNESLGFTKPKGTDSLFNFRGYNKINKAIYEPKKLKKLLEACTETCRLYALLALNCGYTQVDIGSDVDGLRQADLVEIDGEHFLWRKRSKTSHQNDWNTLHFLFPETYALLKKLKAPEDNAQGLMLLNKYGKPLYLNRLGKTQINNISADWADAREASGINLSFKQLRKFGSSAIKSLANADVARLYLSQGIEGELKRYATDDYAPLTKALKKYRLQLKADGII
jgi:integrase